MMNRVASMSLFLDRRMRRIFLLGVMSGLPWVLIGSSLSLWLKEDGLSRSAVGWAGLIFAVYAINFLWAPLVDRLRLPYLTDRLGHRKSWILLMQGIILASLIAWSVLAPSVNITLVIGAGLVIAICSATQDITIDALRIEQIEKEDTAAMAAGASVAVIGWWSGFKIGGLIALMVADKLEMMGIENYWQMTFILLGVFSFCAILACFSYQKQAQQRGKAPKLLHRPASSKNLVATACYHRPPVG